MERAKRRKHAPLPKVKLPVKGEVVAHESAVNECRNWPEAAGRELYALRKRVNELELELKLRPPL